MRQSFVSTCCGFCLCWTSVSTVPGVEDSIANRNTNSYYGFSSRRSVTRMDRVCVTVFHNIHYSSFSCPEVPKQLILHFTLEWWENNEGFWLNCVCGRTLKRAAKGDGDGSVDNSTCAVRAPSLDVVKCAYSYCLERSRDMVMLWASFRLTGT